jgi:pantetheine-phosphate adenylyltransferase
VSTAVYPGSFDPITFGHLDVLRRAAAVFDRVVVGVLANPRKTAVLSVDERIAIIRRSIQEHCGEASARIDVEAFGGLTVEFCRARGAAFIVRGLRAISDFESELQLGHANRKLAPEVDTVFFMTSLDQSYVSSSLVKEIAQFGGAIDGLVPAGAAEALQAAFSGTVAGQRGALRSGPASSRARAR